MPTKVGTHHGAAARTTAGPMQERPGLGRGVPMERTWAQYWALRVTPEKVLYAFTRTYQVPAAGLFTVQVSLLPLRYGRQVYTVSVGALPRRM